MQYVIVRTPSNAYKVQVRSDNGNYTETINVRRDCANALRAFVDTNNPSIYWSEWPVPPALENELVKVAGLIR